MKHPSISALPPCLTLIGAHLFFFSFLLTSSHFHVAREGGKGSSSFRKVNDTFFKMRRAFDTDACMRYSISLIQILDSATAVIV